MQRLHWSPVFSGDEYRERGDTHYVDAHSASFYYNDSRRVVRRYGMDGSYAEFGVRARPEARHLSGLFYGAKVQGRLKAVEPGKPEFVAA